jgi:type IV secretory pathway component VirB8
MIVQEVSTARNPSQYILTVTLTCVFDPEFVVSDEDRVINPLGFKVVAYRADKDIAKLSTEN